METQKLSDILSEMNVFQVVDNKEDIYKAREIDNSIKKLRRKSVFPWMIKKTTLRIFKDVLEYPVASDHDEMFFIEEQNADKFQAVADFFNTSMLQFYQDVNSSKNLMAEIWDGGTKMIGLRDKDLGLQSTGLDDAEDVSDYSVSGDASSASNEDVIYKTGSGSIRINIVSDTGIATIKNNYKNSVSDSDYNKKYYFRCIYLAAVPTSIDVRIQTDDSNYLSKNITTQFSGQALKANDWNLIAVDLNTATQTGTFNYNSIASDKIILNGASTGTYYLDSCDLRGWKLMDYWYYSKYNVISSGSSSPDQEVFVRNDVVDTNDCLVGDKEWLAVVKYDAMNRLIGDSENSSVRAIVLAERDDAWDDFFAKYPDNVPLITTIRRENNTRHILTNLQ